MRSLRAQPSGGKGRGPCNVTQWCHRNRAAWETENKFAQRTKQKTNRARIAAVNFYSCPLVPDNE